MRTLDRFAPFIVVALRTLCATALALSAAACASAPLAQTPVAPPAHAPLLRHSVESDGHPLTLWSREIPRPKASILLLHGRTWSALPDFDLQVPGTSRSVMQALNQQGYSTYALDMRGYGATPRDATGWLTPDRAARDLAATLRWVAQRQAWAVPSGQPAPVLLGWSMGSLVGQLTVQREPDLVSAVVLFGYPRDPGTPAAVPPAPAQPPRERNTHAAAISDFISPDVTPPAVVEAYAAAALAADPIRTDWRDLQQFDELDAARVRVPVLLMHGERDPLTPLAAQARLFTGLATPDKQWVVLPGGDHAALIEDTAPAFVAAIVAFIERPAPARR